MGKDIAIKEDGDLEEEEKESGEVEPYVVDFDDTNDTDIKKVLFLRLFERNVCNISQTCRNIGIGRKTYYRWMANDERFKAIVEYIKEGMIDELESQLYRKIKQGNLVAIMFALKCKGKDRGWQEYAKIDHTVRHEIPEIKIVLSGEKRDELQDKE